MRFQGCVDNIIFNISDLLEMHKIVLIYVTVTGRVVQIWTNEILQITMVFMMIYMVTLK